MKIDSRGYAYIGKKFANAEFCVKEAEEGNVLILEKVIRIPAKDAWFYSAAWQKGERNAQDDINAGRVRAVKNTAAYLKGIRKKRAK
jgi:hypothetical protein